MWSGGGCAGAEGGANIARRSHFVLNSSRDTIVNGDSDVFLSLKKNCMLLEFQRTVSVCVVINHASCKIGVYY